MLLFCIDNCRWWKLIQILHNSNVEHVDVDNTRQVEHVRNNDEHADVPMPGKKKPLLYFFKWITCIYINRNKLMKHYDIIAEIHCPSLQVQPCEQSSRETKDQIPEDALLTNYLKRIKVKWKWLKKFWEILIYNKKNYMVFSYVSWVNVWMNALLFFFLPLTKLMFLSEWVNEWFFQLLNDWMVYWII